MNVHILGNFQDNIYQKYFWNKDCNFNTITLHKYYVVHLHVSDVGYILTFSFLSLQRGYVLRSMYLLSVYLQHNRKSYGWIFIKLSGKLTMEEGTDVSILVLIWIPIWIQESFKRLLIIALIGRGVYSLSVLVYQCFSSKWYWNT